MEKLQSIFDPHQMSSYEHYVFGHGTPVVAITAGLHGEEQTAVYVAYQLIEYLQHLETFTGTIHIFPLCNPTAFRYRNRCSPFDNLDLNRSFCRAETGSHTILLANSIWNDVKCADFLLDLHCCGVYGSTYVMAMHGDYDHQYKLTSALGLPNVIRSSGIPGQLFVEFNQSGRQAVLIEMKGGQPSGTVDSDAGIVVFDAALRFLHYTGAIDVAVSRPQAVIYHDKISRITALQNGWFHPSFNAGENCSIGDLIGTLGTTEIRAEMEGTVLAVAHTQYLFSGERIYTVAPFYRGEKS